MPIRSMLLVFAAYALVAGGSAFSQTGADKPSQNEPARSSAWTTVTYPDGSAPRGMLMYKRFCAACHGAATPAPSGGPAHAGAMSPGPMGGGAMVPPGTAELQVKYGGEPPAELEKRTDLTAESVIYFVRRGVGVMPPIRKTELSDADLKTLAKYLAHGR